MVTINKQGYLQRHVGNDVFLIKQTYNGKSKMGFIYLSFPARMIGKKIKLRAEHYKDKVNLNGMEFRQCNLCNKHTNILIRGFCRDCYDRLTRLKLIKTTPDRRKTK